MNPVIQAQVTQFKQTNPVEQYTESDYFETYSIFSIINGVLTENVDPFEAHLEGTEFGVDGCCILIQRKVAADPDTASTYVEQIQDARAEFIFIQAKSGEQFDYGDISKFLDAVYQFFDGGMEGESEQLDDLLEVKEVVYGRPLRTNPRLLCYFATTGTYHRTQRIEKLVDAQRTRLNDLNLFSLIEINLLGARELQDGYRNPKLCRFTRK